MTLHSLVDIVLDYSRAEQPANTALTIESSHDEASMYVRVKSVSEGARPSDSSPTRIEGVRDRLQALYGERHDVGVKLNDHGSSAWITIPFHSVMVTDFVEA